MRTAVVGAGLVGLATACELAADGHEVTVFDQRGSVAAEGSFAHAGLVAPGHVAPWAMTASPRELLSQSSLGCRFSPSTIRWLWRNHRASRPRPLAVSRTRFQSLALYSRDRLRVLSAMFGLEYERADGCLVVLRDAKTFESLQEWTSFAMQAGMKIDLLDPIQCRTVEPGLHAETPLHGGIYLSQAEVGNARQFALLLRNEANRLGVRFQMHTRVEHLQPGQKAKLTLTPSNEDRGVAPAPETVTEAFDAVVLCTGSLSTSLLSSHQVKLPMMPVRGWSLTAPIRHYEAHPNHGPRAAVVDAQRNVMIGRIGNRIRVTGGQHIGDGGRTDDVPADLYRALDDWFPGTAQLGQAQRWSGLRPCVPDGLPILGASGLENVWLNLGHGVSGWTLACGSARAVADAIGRRASGFDLEGLTMDRWRRRRR
jgi:D-amino-acid dehydrogenase